MRDYDSCCWQTPGQGQYRPLPGSEPFDGEIGSLEIVTEYKVEMVLADDCVDAVIAALLQAHPYQQAAYDVWQLRN